MGLERRGNGLYFYRKERRGKRVVSIYSGGGYLAQCFDILDQQRREEDWLEKKSKKESFEAEKQKLSEIDQIVESFGRKADVLAEALFLINGYHKHSRQWRRKRDDNKSEA